MAFNQKEQEIIQYGVKNGKTRAEVEAALSNFRAGIVKPPVVPVVEQKPSYLQRVGTAVKGNVTEASQSLDQSIEGTKNPFQAGANIAKNVTSAVLAPVSEALRPVAEKTLVPVTNAIVDSKIGNQVTDAIAENVPLPVLETGTDLLETGLNTLAIQGTAQLAEQTAKGVKNQVAKIEPSKVISGLRDKSGSLLPKSPEIMDKVARLKPTDAVKFKKMTGETQGEYLTRTGNFGGPEKILQNEAIKFAKSKASVDTELAKLPGKYQPGPVKNALEGLYEKALKTSTAEVPSPYLSQVQELLAKFNKQGLDMGEINLVKRLFEREVKLGYSKLNNPDLVTKATNVDNALREWQVGQAETLGFKNISQLNKQTQASKFLIDKLGDQVVGQNGLNQINLTDWIVLGGGDPTSVAGFLTKKFFSSKSVQAKIAEMLNKNNIEPHIEPNVGPSEVKLLNAPKPGSPQSQINVPIKKYGPTTFEKSVPRATPPSNPLSQPKLAKVSETLSKSTIKEPTLQVGGKTLTLKDIHSAEGTRLFKTLSKADQVKFSNFDKTQSRIQMIARENAMNNSTVTRIIPKSIAKKPGIIKKIIDIYKNTPNKEGGFIRIGGKKFAEIPEATKLEMVKTIDYLRSNAQVSKGMEATLDKLMEKYNINQGWSNTRIANALEDLIDKTKTK